MNLCSSLLLQQSYTSAHRVEDRGGPRYARPFTRTAWLRAQALDDKAVALHQILKDEKNQPSLQSAC
jgi:hypothetical protein